MRKPIEFINRKNQPHNPKNGNTRIRTDSNGNEIVETFINGSWRTTIKNNSNK